MPLEGSHTFSEMTFKDFSRTSNIKLHFSGTIKLLSGGRLNKKDGLTRYGDSHVKDKTS